MDAQIQSTAPYPNPADNVIHIPLPGDGLPNRRLRIIDANGLIVADRRVDSETTLIRFDISALKPGWYTYQLYTTDRTLLTEKFIKK